jgi:hypothetical protein
MIRAAPDMLKALRRIEAEADAEGIQSDDGEFREWLWALRDIARAAIEKTK